MVGDNGTSLEAVGTQLRRAGHSVEVLSRALRGEAREAATPFVDVLAGHRQHAAPRAWVAGGETTVTVTGPGRGGRNQELALAVALGAEAAGVDPHLAWVFLSGGTDGVDGPTDAAGGMVDPGSLGRMRRAGVDPRAALDANDAYRALASSGDLLRTGPTGTNVADLQVLLIGG
ncbi:MAG: MOFRL family protein [Sandaracinaceae bacterium]